MSKLAQSLLYRGVWSVVLLSQTVFLKPAAAEIADLQRETRIQLASSAVSQILLANDPRRSRRRTRSLAASRGDCQIAGENLPQLLTLVPDDLVSEPLPTTSARPTFWVYSPYVIDENTRVEFQLYNRSNRSSFRPVFSQNIESVQPGIFGITLPSSAPALEPGNEYQWFISIYCDGNDTTLIRDSAFIRLSSETTPNSTVWYDQVNNLAKTLHRDPNSPLRRDWENLLNSAGLGDLIEQSIVD